MKPILFAENSTVFTSNGIGRLSDAVSCYVSEERNGAYELEMVYPSSGAHYSDISIRSIIVVCPYIGANLQAFRVYQITKPINGQVVVKAQHISYDLSKNTAMPFSVAASAEACNNALQGLKANAVETCPFTFWTNVQTLASYSQTAPATIRSRLGGVEGSILDQFHGEYEFDNYTVKFHSARGSDNGVVLRYGKNITDIKQDENIAETITGIVPFWASYDGTETVTLPEKVVYVPNASAYSEHLTVPLDLSSNYQEAPTVATLRAAAQAYINSHDLGVPKVSIDVSFVNLADTEEYRDEMEMLQTVKLCDTITVQFETLGIDVKAKIVKYEWDVLGEKYKSLSVGSIRSSLATTLNEQNSQLMDEIVRAGQASAEATSWLTKFGGYVVAIKDENGKWEALAFSDNPDPTDEHAQVLLINQNGMGFSKSGIDGPYYSAWTLDGHLTLGGVNNEYGTLTLMGPNPSNPSQMIQIGKWDKDGISATKGNFSGSISGSSISGSSISGTNISGGTISGATINWGTATRYAKMYWKDITSNVGALQIETSLNQFGYNDQINIKSLSVNVDGKMTVIDELRANSNLYLTGDLIGGDFIFRYSLDADESITMFILGTSGTVLMHDATGKFVNWTNPSDIRTKENIKDIETGFIREFFEKTKPVEFNFKNDEDKNTHYGLVAQELEEVLKDLGIKTELVGELQNKDKTKYVDYLGLIGILLGAVKDLYKRVSELEEKIKKIEEE